MRPQLSAQLVKYGDTVRNFKLFLHIKEDLLWVHPTALKYSEFRKKINSYLDLERSLLYTALYEKLQSSPSSWPILGEITRKKSSESIVSMPPDKYRKIG